MVSKILKRCWDWPCSTSPESIKALAEVFPSFAKGMITSDSGGSGAEDPHDYDGEYCQDRSDDTVDHGEVIAC